MMLFTLYVIEYSKHHNEIFVNIHVYTTLEFHFMGVVGMHIS